MYAPITPAIKQLKTTVTPCIPGIFWHKVPEMTLTLPQLQNVFVYPSQTKKRYKNARV